MEHWSIGAQVLVITHSGLGEMLAASPTSVESVQQSSFLVGLLPLLDSGNNRGCSSRKDPLPASQKDLQFTSESGICHGAGLMRLRTSKSTKKNDLLHRDT